MAEEEKKQDVTTPVDEEKKPSDEGTSAEQKVPEEEKKQPLTFKKWILSALLAKAFALVPIAIWAFILGYLVWTGGPKTNGSAKLYDYFQRLYPLMGFFVFMAIGFGWKLGAGKARGGGAILSASLMGIVIVLFCNLANFYVMDPLLFPFQSRATIYSEHVEEYNTWILQHNVWVRSGATTGNTILVEKNLTEEAVEISNFKTWYIQDHNKWVDSVEQLAPEYNAWAKKNSKPIWVASAQAEDDNESLWTIPDKHPVFPGSFGEFIETLPAFFKTLPKRWVIHLNANKKGKILLSVSWVIWLCGIVFGCMWLPRRKISEEELKRRQVALRAARKAARDRSKQLARSRVAAKREAKPDEGDKKEESKEEDKKEEDKKVEEKKD